MSDKKITRRITLGIVAVALATPLVMKIQTDADVATKQAQQAEAAYRQGQALTTDTPPTTPISRSDQKALDEIEHSLTNPQGVDR